MDDLLDLSWSEPSKKPATGGSSGGMAGSSFDMLSRPKGANYYSGTSTPAASSKPASAAGSSANLAGMAGGAGGGLGGLRPSTSTTPARTASPAAPAPSANANVNAGSGADAFSDLLGMSGAGTSKNLSMAEKQAQLAAQKAKADEEERQRWGDGAFFDQLGGGGSGGGTAPVAAPKPAKLGAALQPTQSATSSRPSSTAPSKPAAAAKPASAAGSFWDDDDLLGGNKAKPSSPAPAQSKPAPKPAASKGSFWDDDLLNGSSGDKAKKDDMAWDDDDAAGLLGNAGGGSSSTTRPADPWDFDALATSVPSSGAGPGASGDYGDDDDDLLGELGRPAPARPRSSETRGSRPTSRGAPPTKSRATSPPPHIIGQIVEMGFAPDRARAALAATDSGEDVQAALEMLLASRGGTPAGGGAPDQRNYDDDDEDDEYARERAAEARYAEEERGAEDARRARHAARRRGPNRDAIRPRTQDERERDRDREGQGQGQGAGTDDLAEHADRLMAQASEIGSSMLSKASMFWSQGKEKALKVYEEQRRALEAQQSAARRKPPADGRPRWMVEAEEAERAGAAGDHMPPGAEFGDDALGFHDSDEESSAPPPAPAPRTKAAPPPANAARVRADEPKKAYVSPFRHGKGRGGAASPAPAPTPVRPPSPRKERALVPASAGQVSAAAGHKEKGNEHFKLGRFAEAESAYSAAITALPAGHIHLVPLHNNRAATWLKLGEPGRAAADCAVVIELVGPTYHPNKEVPLPPDVGVRLGDALVKATAKRAQAHEMAEKWKLALDDWEKVLGYDAALGGAGMKSQASDGIRRAKAMLGGNGGGARSAVASSSGAGASAAPPRPKPTPKPRATPSRPADVSSSTAVSELRAAAAAAEAEDEQRAALKDSVEERLGAWKKGKETNIRALLASLDSVLWDAVLLRVGMHELVTPKQVKIKYMKVIARLHPDKLASATVEQKMLANGVFGTLSEAYTAFNNGA